MSDREDDDENVDREEEQQQDTMDHDEDFGGSAAGAVDGDGDGNADAGDDQEGDANRKTNVADVFGDSDDEDDDEEAQKRDEEMIRQLNNKKRPRQSEPEENDEDDEEEDEGDGDEDDGEEFSSKKAAKSKKGKQPQKKRPKKKRIDVSNFFLEEAEQGEDEDEEEEENRQAAEEILEEDHQAAVDAVERRHQAARERLNMSAEELAEEYERRHKEQARRQKMQGQIYGGEGGAVRLGGSAVMQQSLLPSINDPGIWKVRCSTGKEQMLVRSIFLKAADAKHRGQPIYIKSAFCNTSKGYVYIEALAEPYAREAIQGLRGLYQSSFQRIAVREMTTLLTVTVTKKPLKIGQWVRLKRSVLKGDLARVVDVLEGGAKVLIQAVPRPDFDKKGEKEKSSSSGSKAKPAQRMFDVEEAKGLGMEVSRRPHPADRRGRTYDFFGTDYYRDGYLYKEVAVATFIETENVKPRLDELRLFQSQAAKAARDEDDPDYDDDDADAMEAAADSQSLLKDIASQLKDLGEDEAKGGVTPYVRGDMVQVTAGELRNLVGRVLTVDEVNRSVTIVPMNSVLTGATVVEADLLVKYVVVGAHVKVVSGQHTGQTGRVVSVNNVDGEHIAAILTDGMNTEIQSNVSSLQISSEVATGHGHLDGYELYDLVALNENEFGVVVMVGNESLRVVNHMDLTKDVVPQQLQGKKNHQSNRASGFDSQQTSIYPGDTVQVVFGAHVNKSGTIRHIMKGNLWLHSNTFLKNSGVFAVRARLCVVAGKRAGVGGAGPSSFSSTASSASVGSKVAAVTGPNYKAARDSNVGKTVRITKGQWKGELAQVVDATGTHYNVELLSKMRKVMVEKEKTMLVGDKGGTLDPEKRAQRHYASDQLHNVGGADGVPNTPFLMRPETPGGGGETPHQLGSETPLQGNETPLGGRTPGYGEGDAWAIRESDELPMDSGRGVGQMSGSSVSGWGTSNMGSNMTYNSNAGGASSSLPPTPQGSNYHVWDRHFVVTIRSGKCTGKLAVITRRPTSVRGCVDVCRCVC